MAAVNFIVEDGTGLTDSTSYISVDDADQYALDLGVTWLTGSDQKKKKQALNAAAQWIDEYFAPWKGYRSNEDQALRWPREGVVDDDNYDIQSDEIPNKLKDATVEAAIYWTDNGKLFPAADNGGQLSVSKIQIDVIKIEKEFTGSSKSATINAKIWNLLQDYMGTGKGINSELKRG